MMRILRILWMAAALYVGLQLTSQICLGQQNMKPRLIVCLKHAADGEDMITRIWEHQWEYYRNKYPGSYECRERQLENPPKCTRK